MAQNMLNLGTSALVDARKTRLTDRLPDPGIFARDRPPRSIDALPEGSA